MIDRNPQTIDEAIARYGPGILDYLKLVKARPMGSGVRIIPPTVQDGDYSISPQSDPATVLPLAEFGAPAGFVLAAYQTILSYTVPAGKIAYISEISFTSNKPLVAQWQLTIRGNVLITGKKISGALNLSWPGSDGRGIKLDEGATVLIQALSDGATTVLAEALAVGILEG